MDGSFQPFRPQNAVLASVLPPLGAPRRGFSQVEVAVMPGRSIEDTEIVQSQGICWVDDGPTQTTA